jgi:Heterodisulfide reductase, subunit B
MKYSYFPGCTLKNKASRLDESARLASAALGFGMEEIPEWQCCGGVYSLAKNESATKLASVRALVYARDNNLPLLTLCSACHNVIKQVNADMKNDAAINMKINNYMKLDTPYNGEAEVVHYLEVLRDKIGFDQIKKKVVRPLEGKKIGAYYGCLLLRPSRVMQFDDPENPKILEDFLRALGAEPVIYAERNECCGAYQLLENRAAVEKRKNLILGNAEEYGATGLVTACPLCQYNLSKGQNRLPVIYFTELLAYALGVWELEENRV